MPTRLSRSLISYGGNALHRDLYSRYEADPKSVDAEWQAFFGSLKDAPTPRKTRRRLLEEAATDRSR